MKAIFKREVKSYFTGMIGWVVAAVSLFFLGLYYTNRNLLYDYIKLVGKSQAFFRKKLKKFKKREKYRKIQQLQEICEGAKSPVSA